MKPFPAQKMLDGGDLRFVRSFVLQREEGSLILRSRECRFKMQSVGEAGKNSRLILVAEGERRRERERERERERGE